MSAGNEPLVSVIIPSYNRAEFVVEAVKSAFDQTYSAVEVIVVDDGSTDDTCKRLQPYFNQIRYIYQLNRGAAGARNTGIEAAKGKLIAFLDADDLWLPIKLELQVKSFERNTALGLVHSNVFYFGPNNYRGCKTKVAMSAYEGDCYGELFLRNRITTSSVIVRRDCLAKVGVFDETIRRASTEDYDLWIRIARYFEFAYVEEPLVRYRMHVNNAVNDGWTLIENECYVLEKAITADPCLSKRIGRQRVHERLFDMYFSLGYRKFEQGLYTDANRWFLRALEHKVSLGATLLWTVTRLPRHLIRNLRLLKKWLNARNLKEGSV